MRRYIPNSPGSRVARPMSPFTFSLPCSRATPTVSSPANYVSGETVQVWVKVGGNGLTAFDSSTDLVRITAAP